MQVPDEPTMTNITHRTFNSLTVEWGMLAQPPPTPLINYTIIEYIVEVGTPWSARAGAWIAHCARAGCFGL